MTLGLYCGRDPVIGYNYDTRETGTKVVPQKNPIVLFETRLTNLVRTFEIANRSDGRHQVMGSRPQVF